MKNKESIDKYAFILDNAPTHWALKTREYLESLKIRVMYLPPYSPTLAPIELLF